MKKPWAYFKGARKYVFLCVLFLAFTEILALVFPMLLKSITQLLNEGTTSDEIIVNGLVVFGVVILIFIVNFLGEVFGAVATSQLQKNLRAEMFERLQNAPAERVNELGVGTILPLIMNDTAWIRNMQRNYMLFAVYFPIAILGSIVMLFSLDVFYGIFALASLPFVIVFLIVSSRKLGKIMPKSINGFDTTHVQVKEGIVGAKEVRIFNKAQQREEEFEELFWYGRQQTSKTFKSINLSASFHAVVYTLVTVAIIIYGAYTMTNVDQLVVINTAIIYVNWLWSRSREVFKLFVDYVPRLKIAKQRIAMIYNLPIAERGGRLKPDLAGAGSAALAIEKVSYKYPSGVVGLANISIGIEKGALVTVTGGAGSGRTEISQLLLQYIKPTVGSITINDIDIFEIDPSFYRRNMVAFCDQVPEFVQGTIRDNLRLLAPQATDAQILKLFNDIGAGSFIGKFDNFLGHQIGERDGFNMSTKKLLNLARTLLKPAQVYIFNQCFDHVNPEYIVKIFRMLKREKKTCLFITQSTIISEHCDKIYVLKKGAVSGVGTHEELLDNNCDYCELCLASGGRIISDEVAKQVDVLPEDTQDGGDET